MILAAIAIFKSKKKKSREYAKWTETFPITEDCVAMDNIILAAEERWKVEDKEFNQTKKIKVQVRINQKRERDTLRDYINDMRNYRKDLVCGMGSAPASMPAPANQPAIVNPPMSQETVLVPATLVNTGNTNAPGGGLALMPNQQSMQQLQASTPEAGSETEKKPAVDQKMFLGLTKKQLIIGAVALAAVGGVVYFMRKN